MGRVLTDPQTIALIAAAVFLLAGTVKGTVGIGLPTVAVGLLTQIIPPHTAVSLVVIPIILSNLWQVIRTGGWAATIRRYRVMAGCLVVTLWLTSSFITSISPTTLLGIIGTAIVIFSASSLVRLPPELPDRHDLAGQIAAGTVSGVLGGLTGIWAAPLVIYLLARRVEKDDFVRAVGMLLFLGGLPLCVGLWQSGLLDGESAKLSALMVIPTILGFTLGEVIRRRLDATRFRKALLWMFLLMGLNLLRRAIF